MIKPFLVAIVALAGCARTLTPAEAEDRRLRTARQEQRDRQQAEYQAALHAYCLQHPLECQRAAAEQQRQEQARRNAVMQALFGPEPQKPYPTETRTSCMTFGSSAECTTTRR